MGLVENRNSSENDWQELIWPVLYPDRIEGLLTHQIPRLCKRDSGVRRAIATAYSWAIMYQGKLDEGAIREILGLPSIFSEETLLMLFYKGVVSSYLLTRLGVPMEEHNKSFAEIAAGNSDIPVKTGSWSNEMRTLAWYAFWYDHINKLIGRCWDYEESLSMIETLTAGFGLTPPEFI